MTTSKPDDHGAIAAMGVAGLIALGVVHLAIAWLALQVAFGSSGSKETDQSGAMQLVAEQPLGTALLWGLAIGLFMLAAWQVAEAIWGHTREDAGWNRTRHRLGSAGKAIAYGALGVSAVREATGPGSSSKKSSQSWTADLMSAPAGQLLVGAVGVAVIAIAVYLIIKGVRRSFTKHLESDTGPVVLVGQVGHIAKGAAYVIVGGLVIYAAWTHNPKKSGGLDSALATVRDQPFGPWLLAAVALGVAAYGVYCFAWAKALRHDV